MHMIEEGITLKEAIKKFWELGLGEVFLWTTPGLPIKIEKEIPQGIKIDLTFIMMKKDYTYDLAFLYTYTSNVVKITDECVLGNFFTVDRIIEIYPELSELKGKLHDLS